MFKGQTLHSLLLHVCWRPFIQFDLVLLVAVMGILPHFLIPGFKLFNLLELFPLPLLYRVSSPPNTWVVVWLWPLLVCLFLFSSLVSSLFTFNLKMGRDLAHFFFLILKILLGCCIPGLIVGGFLC